MRHRIHPRPKEPEEVESTLPVLPRPAKPPKQLVAFKKLRKQRLDAELTQFKLKTQISPSRVKFEVLDMKERGYSHLQISETLGIDSIEVTKALMDALDEYYVSRDEAVKHYLAIANSRYNRILRTWFPLMEPREELVQNEDGTTTKVVHPPDPEAARIVIVAMRDAAKMMGLNKIRVEHTGKDGSPIDIDVIANLNDEQLAKFIASGDEGILRSFAGAIGGACAPGNETETGT